MERCKGIKKAILRSHVEVVTCAGVSSEENNTATVAWLVIHHLAPPPGVRGLKRKKTDLMEGGVSAGVLSEETNDKQHTWLVIRHLERVVMCKELKTAPIDENVDFGCGLMVLERNYVSKSYGLLYITSNTQPCARESKVEPLYRKWVSAGLA